MARPSALRCSELSLAAGEPLHATATHATEWLLIEVPGSWARDVGGGEGLPAEAREAVVAWRDGGGGEARRRVLFVRRPGRSPARPLAFHVLATEGRQSVRRVALAGHADLAGLRVETAGEPVETSLVLVCGHGSRDRCCAPAGTSVFAALAESLGEEELWISSHQGGHRFAANVLVLPAGVQLGRIGAGGVSAVVRAARAGEIDPDHYRGRTCYPPAAQAAEHAIRMATGLRRVDALRLEDAVDGTRFRFRAAAGGRHAAVVERVTGPEVPASCGEPAEPQPVLRGRVVD